MIEIVIDSNTDSYLRKSISHFAVKYLVNPKKFVIENFRKRRTRDQNGFTQHWLIPYGSSEIDFNSFKFTIEYNDVGEPVGLDSYSTIHKELKLIVDETIYPDYKSFIDNFLKEARTYYKNEIMDQSPELNKVTCYIWDDFWDDIYKRNKRPLRTVHLNKDADKVLADMQKFRSKESETLYENLGIPYKRNYLFEGYPGTGKTSLTYSLASELNMDVAIINFNKDMDDVMFTRAMLRIPDDTILVLEDIDVLFTENRKKNDANKNMITLSGLLNILDGLTHQEKQIIIMTTNFKCTLDNALQRPGRIDYVLHFDFANRNQINAMFNKFLPNQKDNFEVFYKAIKYLDITTATLQQYLFSNLYCENILDNISELKKLVENTDYTGKKLNMYA